MFSDIPIYTPTDGVGGYIGIDGHTHASNPAVGHDDAPYQVLSFASFVCLNRQSFPTSKTIRNVSEPQSMCVFSYTVTRKSNLCSFLVFCMKCDLIFSKVSFFYCKLEKAKCLVEWFVELARNLLISQLICFILCDDRGAVGGVVGYVVYIPQEFSQGD